MNKIVAVEISGHTERLGAVIGIQNLHFRQKLARNNDNAFFTNCSV